MLNVKSWRSEVFFFGTHFQSFILPPNRPKSARGIFFYTLLMTNVPDLFKLPMDALRLRVIIGKSAPRGRPKNYEADFQ